jgi:hypothetical protein
MQTQRRLVVSVAFQFFKTLNIAARLQGMTNQHRSNHQNPTHVVAGKTLSKMAHTGIKKKYNRKNNPPFFTQIK